MAKRFHRGNPRTKVADLCEKCVQAICAGQGLQTAFRLSFTGVAQSSPEAPLVAKRCPRQSSLSRTQRPVAAKNSPNACSELQLPLPLGGKTVYATWRQNCSRFPASLYWFECCHAARDLLPCSTRSGLQLLMENKENWSLQVCTITREHLLSNCSMKCPNAEWVWDFHTPR